MREPEERRLKGVRHGNILGERCELATDVDNPLTGLST